MNPANTDQSAANVAIGVREGPATATAAAAYQHAAHAAKPVKQALPHGNYYPMRGTTVGAQSPAWNPMQSFGCGALSDPGVPDAAPVNLAAEHNGSDVELLFNELFNEQQVNTDAGVASSMSHAAGAFKSSVYGAQYLCNSPGSSVCGDDDDKEEHPSNATISFKPVLIIRRQQRLPQQPSASLARARAYVAMQRISTDVGYETPGKASQQASGDAEVEPTLPMLPMLPDVSISAPVNAEQQVQWPTRKGQQPTPVIVYKNPLALERMPEEDDDVGLDSLVNLPGLADGVDDMLRRLGAFDNRAAARQGTGIDSSVLLYHTGKREGAEGVGQLVHSEAVLCHSVQKGLQQAAGGKALSRGSVQGFLGRGLTRVWSRNRMAPMSQVSKQKEVHAYVAKWLDGAATSTKAAASKKRNVFQAAWSKARHFYKCSTASVGDVVCGKA